MKAKNCTVENLQAALDIVNVKYEGNIKFKSLEMKGKQIQFTLTVIDSKKPGHRRGFPRYNYKWGNLAASEKIGEGKRMAFACWHVHGDFFDALFSVNPNAAVLSGGSLAHNDVKSNWITINGGNWQDRNIGSQMFPLYFSEACDCGKGE